MISVWLFPPGTHFFMNDFVDCKIMPTYRLSLLFHVFQKLRQDRSGNFGIITALLATVLLLVAGGAIDVAGAYVEKERLQGLLDSAVLAAVHETDPDRQFETAKQFLASGGDASVDYGKALTLTRNSDGSLSGVYAGSSDSPFLSLIGLSSLNVSVTSTAIASTSAAAGGPCIYVLASRGQDVLINSGANITSKACEIHVHSKAAPAFIMNAGSTIDTAKFCVRGTNYIKNGGTISNMQVGCSVDPDPYAGALPEPSVPSNCTSSGWINDQVVSLKPGLHCDTGFNGSPTITFEPGLHIIRGRMIINSNATVTAEGVTFYFPDVYSEIRINGGVKFRGIAPTSGTYKGILMFEKTSDPANNLYSQQYIFNGSLGETLEGIIYLPNRDVTYNSTTNQVNRISMVVNSMIMNSANWQIEPYTSSGGGSGGTASGARLVN